MYPYNGADDDELSFGKGDVIYVVEFPDPEEQVSEGVSMQMNLSQSVGLFGRTTNQVLLRHFSDNPRFVFAVFALIDRLPKYFSDAGIRSGVVS